MDFFKKLQKKGLNFDENQRKAIEKVNGPLLVAAGPGSGKTSVITARAAYLILNERISPSNILVVTFTRAAANEMKQRFSTFPGITPEHCRKIDFGTFHSTFYKIISSYYGRRLPVLEGPKLYHIIKNILSSLDEPCDDDTIQNTLNDISNAAITCRGPSGFQSRLFSPSKFMEIYNQYQHVKKSLNCIDFDDMMLLCEKILLSEKELLDCCRQKYKYIMVDEFQDSNKLQFDILKLLCHPLNNLCAVGDDDQSIYSFRGALPGCLKEFEEYYNPCPTVVLNINYRSTEAIIDMSKKLISFNTNRIHKNLISGRKVKGDNAVIVYPQNEEEEASFVGDTIEDLKHKGFLYSDFAVLCRVNIQSRAVMDELHSRNIPFQVKDDCQSFFDHWICRDLASYLKLSININDFSSFSRIVNRPSRYIPKEAVNKASSVFFKEGKGIFESLEDCGLKSFQVEHLNVLQHNLKILKNMAPSSGVKFIRKNMEYENYVRRYCMESNIDYDELRDILNEFEASASAFNRIEEFLSHINVMSLKLKEQNTSVNRNSVTLTTIHGAKGLEFRGVFIIGAVEGFIPHKKAIGTGEGIEEERRLFYVALTRAKDALYISSPKRYHDKEGNVSRFLSEALSKCECKSSSEYTALFKTGELVSHNKFGTGKVISLNGSIIEISFNNSNGRKLLDLRSCLKNKLLEKISSNP